jgi:hypothetical protein
MLDSWQCVLRIVLAILADYRLSELLAIDDGPGHMFRRLREWAGRKAAENSNKGIWVSLAELVTCPFCLGIWLAGFFTILIVFPSVLGDVLIILLAIAGGQTYLESTSNGRDIN